MNVKMRMNAPMVQEIFDELAGPRLTKPTIMSEMKIPINPQIKMVRRPKRLIKGHERTVPTNAIAYCVVSLVPPL
jgi:hypothetical protein